MCNGSVHGYNNYDPRNRRFEMSFNLNGYNVFKVAAGISALGFAWFTFATPEAVNAASKANFCVIGFFASLALYYYSLYNKEREYVEQDSMWKRFDEQDRDFNYRIEEVWRSVNALEDKCCNGSSCPKKGR
jgi:hypothetical protein